MAARRIQALHVDSTAGRDLSKARAQVEEMQAQLKAKVACFPRCSSGPILPACAVGREVGVSGLGAGTLLRGLSAEGPSHEHRHDAHDQQRSSVGWVSRAAVHGQSLRCCCLWVCVYDGRGELCKHILCARQFTLALRFWILSRASWG